MVTGASTSYGTSVDIAIVPDSEGDGTISLRLTAFSPSSRWTSVALWYKSDPLGKWNDDMTIIASGAKASNGNEMYGIPCSITGEEIKLTWNHAANGVASGSRCMVKAVVLPAATVICSAEGYSWIETVFRGEHRITDGSIRGDVVGFDAFGGAIVIGENSVAVFDVTSREKLLEIDGIALPRHAAGLPNGNIVVITANGMILEYDDDGKFIRSFNASALASGYPLLSIGRTTGNILVSGGNTPMVSEISWGGDDYGTLLWSLGGAEPGNDLTSLNSPMGASYGSGAEIVILCDSGNNRMLSIDRSTVPQSVTNISSVMVGDYSTELLAPAWCVSLGDDVYVCELSGKPEAFSSTPSRHPSMARSGMAPAAGDDAIPQYSGMCFVPIARSIK